MLLGAGPPLEGHIVHDKAVSPTMVFRGESLAFEGLRDYRIVPDDHEGS